MFKNYSAKNHFYQATIKKKHCYLEIESFFTNQKKKKNVKK